MHSNVLYTTFIGRYATLLGTLLDLNNFESYRTAMIRRHDTTSALGSLSPGESRQTYPVYSSDTFRQPDRSSQDPTSSLYEKNYMPKRRNFLFELNRLEDSGPLNDYGEANMGSLGEDRALNPFYNTFRDLFEYGSKSAKFDNGYLLYSAWTGDSCALAAESNQLNWSPTGWEPEGGEFDSPLYVLNMKRLFVEYALKTKELTGKNISEFAPSYPIQPTNATLSPSTQPIPTSRLFLKPRETTTNLLPETSSWGSKIVTRTII
jgi:hypothetical protein